ncbi:MAG: 4-hydroxythreonine-4-phosphate dehydrogenase PdxA [Christensenella sp.]|uniref:4-hydroxythreonine-4-phosphate dehydrogenase PdxA n=1 Tax=Christensenella sp. TaxID=1935934 RepID=UPI002B1F0C4A|nr:4-hydroxythreonine-4-phosphate dehydrogenase PdxA [Christensenella sp.]MEA5001972.1 4-hydroxythreonine-4-phosphate dehydrogenase PdxA [Christensenella sp.]
MKPILAITMGDAAGVGAEIAVKALRSRDVYETCIPVVVGDYEPMADAVAFTNSGLALNRISDPSQARGEFGVIDVIDMGFLQPQGWEYKKVSAKTGDAAYNYVVKGIELVLGGQAHAVVTGPINKEAIHQAGHQFAGHTEIFAHQTQCKNYAMMLTSKDLRVIHCTTHVSLKRACDLVTTERVLTVIRLADEALKLLGIKQPKIAVAGLNPHCSENGLFGDEEQKWIIPAVEQAQAAGFDVEGPVPPDTVFVKAIAKQYDIVVAMYHDQGHIPLKMSGFKLNLETNQFESMSGVNTTLGLPVIRTSVDHGTAFDRAGEGRANEESMVEAIEMAVVMAGNKFPELA